MEGDMTDKELAARLSEIQAALLKDFGKPEGLSEAARQNACSLVRQLKRDALSRT
jgi:hypothetical protein